MPSRSAQSSQVTIEQETAVSGRCERLVHAFAVQESVIEHRNDRVLGIGDLAVDVDDGSLTADLRLSTVLRMLDFAQMRVLNAAQMRDADRQTIEEIGIPSMVLMENAGRQVVAALEAAYDDLNGSTSPCCADPATTAATVSSSRGRCTSAASTSSVFVVAAWRRSRETRG